MTEFKEHFWGFEGFEELRKYIKQGNDFSKEIVVLLQERSDAETTYAKNLNKIGTKLLKACGNGVGTLSTGWKTVGQIMEMEADLHRNLASGLSEGISKPLKSFSESQSKARKPLEIMVDKSYKNLLEKRAEELKFKKHSYSNCKENEKVETNTAKGKDSGKTEKKSRQALALMKKADKEYTEASHKAESARQDWESTVAKAGQAMQDLERERLKTCHDHLNDYYSHISVLAPQLSQYKDIMEESVVAVDLQTDLKTIVQQKGMKSSKISEQVLVDCYAEDGQVSIANERRVDALKNYLILLNQLIEKERKGKEGVQKLLEVYKNKPSFTDADTQEDTCRKLEQTTAMLNFLEASHHKINCYLNKMEGKIAPQSIFTQYIESSRDKQSLIVSTLRLPLQVAIEGNPEFMAYGGHDSPNDYYQQMDSQEDEFISEEFPSPTIIGRCKVLYDYQATQADELNIKTGDVIEVFEKLGDGWWEGELNGIRGIFPSTYVHEV